MRSFSDVRKEFDAAFKNFEDCRPKPAKSYIAYNAGESLKTTDRAQAKAFSPKNLIEIIEPDLELLRAWRRDKATLEANVVSQWKRELFAEVDLSDEIAERIFKFATSDNDDRDEQASIFVDAAAMVDDCIRMASNDRG